MESIFKYKNKGCTRLIASWNLRLFQFLYGLFKKREFHEKVHQYQAVLMEYEELKALLLKGMEEVDGTETMAYYLEVSDSHEGIDEGLQELARIGNSHKNPLLVKRIADGLIAYGDRPGGESLLDRLATLPEFLTMEEIDMVECLENFIRRGRYTDVIRLSDEILLRRPTLLRIQFVLGEAFEMSGKTKEATEIFSKMLQDGKRSMNKDEYRVLQHLCNMHLGNLAIAKGEPKKAVSFFIKAFEADVDKKEAVRGKSIAYYQDGDYENAIRAYDLLEKEFEQNFVAFYGKGVTYKAMGKNKEAKSWLLQAKELEPENQSVLYNLSHIEYLEENNDVAMELINRALEMDPEDPDTLYGKAMVFTAMHEYGAALEIFERVIKAKPESAEVYCRKADALRFLGRLDEAEYNYDLALTRNIGLTEAYYGKGMVLAAKGELTEALRIMDDTISVNQGFVDAYIGRSMIQMYFNDLEEGSLSETETLKN